MKLSSYWLQIFFHFRVCSLVENVTGPRHELVVLGYVCNEGEEVISNSLPENVSVIVANDLLADE
jgi:hypothetical protein